MNIQDLSQTQQEQLKSIESIIDAALAGARTAIQVKPDITDSTLLEAFTHVAEAAPNHATLIVGFCVALVRLLRAEDKLNKELVRTE